MHEYSIVAALVERVTEEAERRHATRIDKIVVRIGDRAGVERELLATAFETFRGATACAQTALVIEATIGEDLLLQRIEMEVP